MVCPFHQMLFWEAEYPHYGAEVHHLMVLCYHLQHPHLYSPEGLTYAKGLLVDFVAQGMSPQTVRQDRRAQVDSSQRTWKITGTPTAFGVYDPPMVWRMTASDVVAGGVQHYCENVRAWAQVVYGDLQAAGQL